MHPPFRRALRAAVLEDNRRLFLSANHNSDRLLAVIKAETNPLTARPASAAPPSMQDPQREGVQGVCSDWLAWLPLIELRESGLTALCLDQQQQTADPALMENAHDGAFQRPDNHAGSSTAGMWHPNYTQQCSRGFSL